MDSLETELKDLKKQNSVPQGSFQYKNRGNGRRFGYRGSGRYPRGRGDRQPQVGGQQNGKPLNG